MLELEKNRVKQELRNRTEVILHEQFHAASIQQTVGIMSSFLDSALEHPLGRSPSSPTLADIASQRSFETWARARIETLEQKLKELVSEDILWKTVQPTQKDMKVLEDKNRILHGEIRDMNQRLKRMEEVLSRGEESSPSVEAILNSIKISLENLKYK